MCVTKRVPSASILEVNSVVWRKNLQFGKIAHFVSNW